MLDALLDHPASQIALVDDAGSLTYGELGNAVRALAAELAALHRTAGGAFAIDLADGISWVVVDLACMLARIPTVPLPHFFTAAQRTHAMQSAGVTWCVSARPTTDALKVSVSGMSALSLVPTAFAPVPLPHSTAKITFTSGTTGTPKGVCLSVEGMVRKATQLRAALGDGLIARHRCVLPLAVLLENIGGVYVTLLRGASVRLGLPEYTPAALAEALLAAKATSCILVPELLQALVASGARFPQLRYAAVGGAHVPASLIARARALHIPAYEGYGLSEACSVVALNTPLRDAPDSCGPLLEADSIRIAEDGEILLIRPGFLGYLGEDAPADTFATGDIGHLDADGFLHIDGRKKHVIITSYGRNLSPEWVENVLADQPGIQQALLLGDGLPFNCAIIVAQSPALVAQAIARANDQLPDYARIADYVLADAPFSTANQQLTATGKPNRNVIAAQYAAQIQRIYSEVYA